MNIILLSCTLFRSLKLDSNDYSITITADIVQPKLELLDESTLTPIDKLCLGEVYYGSMKHGAVKLYNNSPSPANYIVLFKEQPGIEQVCLIIEVY